MQSKWAFAHRPKLHDSTGIIKQARAIASAAGELPLSLEMTIVRVLETAEAVAYVALAVGMLLIVAEVNYGVGIVIKESGHIGYESAKIVDTIVNGLLRFIHRITSFFHIHWHPPYIGLEDHLLEFKSSNPRYICSELASYTAMFLVFPRMRWSPHICPIMRYFYGTPIDTIMSPFIGWSSYDWTPEGNNCRKPRNLTICIVCEFYFLIRLVAYLIVFVLIAGPSWPLLSNIIDILIHLTLLLCDIAFALLHLAFRGLHGLWIAQKKTRKLVDDVID